MQTDHFLNLDRLGLMSGALLLGLSFTRLIEAPGRYLVTEALGSPLGINLTGASLILLIMIALAVTSMQALLQGHPLVYQRQVRRTLVFWIMPGLLVTGATGLLLRIERLEAWLISLLRSSETDVISFSETSTTSSSCTCMTTFASCLLCENAPSTAIMARLIISAAVSCMGALMAVLSAY